MKRTSTEAHVYMRRHQGAKVKHFDVSNVIYHKFSHGAGSYTLSGENVNVMLELRNNFFLTRELSLINTCCWRADHEILMHDGGARDDVILKQFITS